MFWGMDMNNMGYQLGCVMAAEARGRDRECMCVYIYIYGSVSKPCTPGEH